MPTLSISINFILNLKGGHCTLENKGDWFCRTEIQRLLPFNSYGSWNFSLCSWIPIKYPDIHCCGRDIWGWFAYGGSAIPLSHINEQGMNVHCRAWFSHIDFHFLMLMVSQTSLRGTEITIFITAPILDHIMCTSHVAALQIENVYREAHCLLW